MNDEQLETKLREVLIQLAEAHAFNVFSEVKKPNPTGYAIGRIRQVFRDAGYECIATKSWSEEVNSHLITIKDVNGDELLAGRAWLSRFQSELAADQPLHDPKNYQYLSKHALAIAKRATGIQ